MCIILSRAVWKIEWTNLYKNDFIIQRCCSMKWFYTSFKVGEVLLSGRLCHLDSLPLDSGENDGKRFMEFPISIRDFCGLGDVSRKLLKKLHLFRSFGSCTECVGGRRRHRGPSCIAHWSYLLHKKESSTDSLLK